MFFLIRKNNFIVKKLIDILKSSCTIKRLVVSALLIQFFLILLFAGGLYRSGQIKLDDCKIETIVIEEKNIIRSFRETKCCVSSRNVQFFFPNFAGADLSPNQLYNKLDIGASLDVLYTESINIFGKYFLIVEAKDQENIIFELDEYNSSLKKAFILQIVFFCFFEIIYVGMCVLTVRFIYKNEFKSFFKKLKRLKSKKVLNKKENTNGTKA